MTIFSRFMKDESGVTAIEYGLIAAIVGVGIIAVLKNVRTGLQSTFNKVNSELGTRFDPVIFRIKLRPSRSVFSRHRGPQSTSGEQPPDVLFSSPNRLALTGQKAGPRPGLNGTFESEEPTES